MEYKTKYGNISLDMNEECIIVQSTVPFKEERKEFPLEQIKEATEYFKEIKHDVEKIIERIEKKKEESAIVDSYYLNKVKELIEIFKFRKILLYGSTGTGKTYTLFKLCEILKEKGEIDDYLLFTCSSGMEDIDFLGKFIPMEGSKGLKFIPSEFYKMVEKAREKRVIIIVDEFNRVHPKSLNIFIPLLDEKGGKVRLNNFVKGEILEIPQGNIIFLFTANFGGNYTGTFQLDDAILNRVDVALHIDYQYLIEEELIKDSFPESDWRFSFVVGLRDFLRQMYREGMINPFSMRDLKILIQLVASISGERKDPEIMFVKLEPIFHKLVKTDLQGFPDEETLKEIKNFIGQTL